MDTRELIARAEIGDVLTRYARGADRRDWPAVRACYHADAHDDHGLYSGGVDGLIDFLTQLSGSLLSTSHQLGNLLIELDGDVARTEAYCFVWYRRKDRQGVERSIAHGVRYLDRMEARAGRWAISTRVVVLDWEHVFEAGVQVPVASGWQRGAHGQDDPSHRHFAADGSTST